jgi:hypothetical protein
MIGFVERGGRKLLQLGVNVLGEAQLIGGALGCRDAAFTVMEGCRLVLHPLLHGGAQGGEDGFLPREPTIGIATTTVSLSHPRRRSSALSLYRQRRFDGGHQVGHG